MRGFVPDLRNQNSLKKEDKFRNVVDFIKQNITKIKTNKDGIQEVAKPGSKKDPVQRIKSLKKELKATSDRIRELKNKNSCSRPKVTNPTEGPRPAKFLNTLSG